MLYLTSCVVVQAESQGVVEIKSKSVEVEEDERARGRRRSSSGRARSSTAHLAAASRARVIERRYSCDVSTFKLTGVISIGCS